MTAATVTELSLPESPYRGIESFRYVDQPIFFARGKETQQLLRYVSVYRGVLFYGDSGSGKSSLINAGFIPAIIAEGFTPDRLRVQPKPGEEIIVERISTTPAGEAPYLSSSLVDAEDTNARVVMCVVEMKKRLRALDANARPILIFDQFEEFSTLFEGAPRGEGIKQAQKAQEAINKVLLELLRDSSLPVKLLFVFREDYLAKLDRLFALRPELSDQYQRLMPPGMNALHEIIRGSFEKFPDHFNKVLSEDLTRDLAAAIEARSESNKLNLSEVQIASLKLWQSGNPDALFKKKGVQGLLEDYLSDSLNRLGDLRDPAVALLSQMVTSSGTRNVISQYNLITQVHEDEHISEDRLKAALDSLVQDTKLVRRERRYDTYVYDIVSEFLVPWITKQKGERLAEIARQKLEVLRRSRRNKLLVVLSWVLVVIIALLSWWTLRVRTESNKASEQTRRAQEVELLAQNEIRNRTITALQAELVQRANEDLNQAKQEASTLKIKAEKIELENKTLSENANVMKIAWDKEVRGLKEQLGKTERERDAEKKKKEDSQEENLKLREAHIEEIKKLNALITQLKRGTKK